MKVKMLVDIRGPVDGKDIGRFESGKEYEVDAKVGRLFLASAMAVEVKEPAVIEIEAPMADPVRDSMGYVV